MVLWREIAGPLAHLVSPFLAITGSDWSVFPPNVFVRCHDRFCTNLSFGGKALQTERSAVIGVLKKCYFLRAYSICSR